MMPKEIEKAGITIHRVICSTTWDDCLKKHGRCIRAAIRLYHKGQLNEVSA